MRMTSNNILHHGEKGVQLAYKGVYCSTEYPYTCTGANTPCKVCGHLGKYHRLVKYGITVCFVEGCHGNKE